MGDWIVVHHLRMTNMKHQFVDMAEMLMMLDQQQLRQKEGIQEELGPSYKPGRRLGRSFPFLALWQRECAD